MIANNLEELKEYLSNFEQCEGYCKDLSKSGFEIFENEKVKITEFPYEIVFKTDEKSVIVRYLNGKWYVDETDLKELEFGDKDVLSFFSLMNGKKVKMAQIWVEEELFEDIKTKKLKKVIFYGFEGEQK